jgi:hypothetical protein
VANYCSNRLAIEGTPEEIDAFAKDCLGFDDGSSGLPIIDFEKVLPMPPVLKGLHSQSDDSKLGGPYPDQLSAAVVGMEAIRRSPVQWPGHAAPESVLKHPRAKALGLESYDDLQAWLRDNDPTSLERARACLAALDACGFCFEDDWVIVKWGCDPGRVIYDQSDLDETSYVAQFASAWSGPEGIIREIARRHPALTIRYVVLEEGNEYTFRLTAENGVINEEEPPITDAFIEEVEGEGEVESRLEADQAFWEPPPVLKELPMRHFRHAHREAVLKRAVADYPVYRPPHQGLPAMLPEPRARENHALFLAEKARRVEGLARFLVPFGIALDFTDGTKTALDDWLAHYAAFLYVLETPPSFFTHRAEWVGPRRGLNVILDLGIFIGDFAIHENPALRWEMDTDSEPGRTRRDEQFQRPVLAAATACRGFPRDVINEVYGFCNVQCDASWMWKKQLAHFDTPSRAHHFVTRTLRDINLHARGESEIASREAWDHIWKDIKK